MKCRVDDIFPFLQKLQTNDDGNRNNDGNANGIIGKKQNMDCINKHVHYATCSTYVKIK